MIGLSSAIKIIVLLSYILLAFLTLRSAGMPIVRRFFFVYLFGMIYWQFTSLMVNFSGSPRQALFWYNLLFSGTGLYSILFFPFTRAFLGIKGQKALTVAAYVVCVAFIALGPTGLIFREVKLGQAGIYVPKFTNIVYYTGILGYFFWGCGVANLIRGLVREKSPFRRNRIKYLLLGAGFVILATAFNFTPLQDFPIDIACNSINAVLIGYAVIRYRLIDIRVILTRSLFYSLFTGTTVGIYIVSIIATERILQSYLRYTSLSGIVAILILAFVFLPLRNLLQNLIDRLFFREKYDYQAVLEEFSRSTTSVLDFNDLTGLILRTVVDAIKAEVFFILLGDEEQGVYRIERSYRLDQEHTAQIRFRGNSQLASRLRNKQQPLLREEMELNPDFAELLKDSTQFFEAARISLVVPIVLKDRLIGTLNLGQKLSGDMYNDEDLRFLTTLANQTATAIDNALVYGEVERRLSEQTLLFILSEAFRRPPGFSEVIHTAVDVLHDFLKIDFCCLFYLNAGVISCSVRGLSGAQTEAVRVECMPLAGNPVQAEMEEPLLLTDLRQRLRENGNLNAAEREELGAALYLPLKQGTMWLGLLVIPKTIGGRAVDKMGYELLRVIRAIVSQGIMLHRTIGDLVDMKNYSESILNSMSSCVIVVNTDQEITTLNREGARITGLAPEDVLERHIEDVETLHPLGEILSETLQSGGLVLNREMSIRGGNGRMVPVSVSTSVLKDAEDRPTGAIAIVSDMSEIKQLESQLIRSEKLASIGQLAAGVSHELRNPLGSISGYAELIQERVVTDDEVVKRGLATIISESERSKHIIERLLSYARLREPSLETVDINSVIEDTLPLIGHQLTQDNVNLVKDYGSGLPAVRVDVEQMKEVFINLILNSHQAMPDGGALRISTGVRANHIEIRVEDEGHGIPEDDLNRLFDPFFTTKDGGTGLGLSTAYRIIERHGGSIEVESTVGKGSVFTISLNVATESGSRQPAPPRGAETV